jgi:hypothetical protein
MTRYAVLLFAILPLAAANASAEIIDHTSVAGVAGLPQSTMDAVGQQKWLFTHASVGANIIEGMNALHSANPTRYQLQTATAYMTAPPPEPTEPGTVYEINRGNPGWSMKFSDFESLVNNDWHSPTVDFAMDKLCYIDQTADPAVYISTMSALEASNPATTFVYTTMPLTTGEDSDNVLRNRYNIAVRLFCNSNDRLLFDIADIEAYDSAGNASTFLYEGLPYQKLCNDYSADGGHLNTAGSQQVALGWYATAASAVPEPSALILLLIGGAMLVGTRVARTRSARLR